jgi:hypothetical protein
MDARAPRGIGQDARYFGLACDESPTRLVAGSGSQRPTSIFHRTHRGSIGTLTVWHALTPHEHVFMRRASVMSQAFQADRRHNGSETNSAIASTATLRDAMALRKKSSFDAMLWQSMSMSTCGA